MDIIIKIVPVGNNGGFDYRIYMGDDDYMEMNEATGGQESSVASALRSAVKKLAEIENVHEKDEADTLITGMLADWKTLQPILEETYQEGDDEYDEQLETVVSGFDALEAIN